jgi:hypothetical protein
MRRCTRALPCYSDGEDAERAHWWPAQVQQLLEGRFDPYYGARPFGVQ